MRLGVAILEQDDRRVSWHCRSCALTRSRAAMHVRAQVAIRGQRLAARRRELREHETLAIFRDSTRASRSIARNFSSRPLV